MSSQVASEPVYFKKSSLKPSHSNNPAAYQQEETKACAWPAAGGVRGKLGAKRDAMKDQHTTTTLAKETQSPQSQHVYPERRGNAKQRPGSTTE